MNWKIIWTTIKTKKNCQIKNTIFDLIQSYIKKILAALTLEFMTGSVYLLAYITSNSQWQSLFQTKDLFLILEY